MSETERLQVVRAIVESCMWGHGGLASGILERLDKFLPADPSWGSIFRDNQKLIRREYMGVSRQLADLYPHRDMNKAIWENPL